MVWRWLMGRVRGRGGGGRGDVVAVQLSNCADFETVHVAVAAVGGVLMPVHVGYGSVDVLALLRRVGPVVLVVGSGAAAVVDGVTVPSVRLVVVARGTG